MPSYSPSSSPHGLLDCSQFALIGFVRNDDADILQHPRKPFRQIIQHLFNGPFKLIVTLMCIRSPRENALGTKYVPRR